MASNDLISTGIPYVDRLLGGHRPGACHGILGPTGVGKSTLVSMLCAEGAIALDRTRSKDSACWVLFNIEGGMMDALARILCHAARVPRAAVDRGLQITLPPTNYQSYELARKAELPQRNGVVVPERERIAEALQVIHRRLHVVNLGSERFRHDLSPCRYLAHRIGQLVNMGVTIAGVAIDYAGLAVRRSLPDDSTALIGPRIAQFMLECQTEIAQRYHCIVWVVHQLKQLLGKRPPTNLVHHRDASDTRHFGDHLDGCLVLGEHDVHSGCFLLQCTKARDVKKELAPAILKFDPDFLTINECMDGHIDGQRQRIWTGPARNRVNVAEDVLQELLGGRSGDTP
ncbi:MAG: hypothetical protein U0840_29580 [Gemmataceae bacterium]